MSTAVMFLVQLKFVNSIFLPMSIINATVNNGGHVLLHIIFRVKNYILRNYVGHPSGNSSCTRERSQPVNARFLIYITGRLYSYWVSNSTTTSHNFMCCFAMKHCEVKLEKAQSRLMVYTVQSHQHTPTLSLVQHVATCCYLNATRQEEVLFKCLMALLMAVITCSYQHLTEMLVKGVPCLAGHIQTRHNLIRQQKIQA